MRKDKIPRDTMGKEEKKVEPRINLDGEEKDVARIEKGASVRRCEDGRDPFTGLPSHYKLMCRNKKRSFGEHP